MKDRNGVAFFSLLLAGVSLGWLVGLSVSEILHIILGSVIALASGVVSVLAGIKKTPAVEESSKGEKEQLHRKIRPISPLPLMALLLGLAIGAPIGICVRTNDLLGVRVEWFVSRWDSTGLSPQELHLRLFDTLYPGTDSVPAQLPGVLYASPVSGDECEGMILKTGAQLKAELQLLDDETIQDALEKCDSDSCLEAIRVILCRQ